MDYVISPWFFYWINVASGIVGLFVAISIILGILVLVSLIAGLVYKYVEMPVNYFREGSGERDKISSKLWLKITKITSPIFILFVLLVIFTPGKDTLIQMMIAKNVTYTNIEKLSDKTMNSAKELIDYIFEKTQREEEKN